MNSEVRQDTSGTDEGKIIYSDGTIYYNTNWVEMPLKNGFTKNATTGVGGVRVKRVGNRVTIIGSVYRSSSPSAATEICTLSNIFRPTITDGDDKIVSVILGAMAGSRIARLFIRKGGGLYYEWGRNITDASTYTGVSEWIDCGMSYEILD